MKMIWVMAALACGCGNKHEAGGGGGGSAAGSGAGPGAAAMAAGDLAAQFARCWTAWSGGNTAVLEHCYAKDAAAESPGAGFAPAIGGAEIADAARGLRETFPDLKGEPQLVLVNDRKLAAAVRMTGKHAKLSAPIGVLGGVLAVYDAAGLVTHESDFFDTNTIAGQLVVSKTQPARPWDGANALAKQTVIAKHDAAEAANVAVVKQLVEAFDRHDFAAFGALLPDDATWSDQAEAKDWTKAELIADHQAGVQSFPDLKMVLQDVWGAGDFVVESAQIEGTNDGDIRGALTPTHKKIVVPYLAIHQVVAGKVAHTWVFEQGLALPTQLGLK